MPGEERHQDRRQRTASDAVGPAFLGAPDSWLENPPFGRVTEGSGWYELPSRARLAGGTPLVVYRQPLPCSRPPLPESTLMTIERPRRLALRLLPTLSGGANASRVRDWKADADWRSTPSRGDRLQCALPHSVGLGRSEAQGTDPPPGGRGPRLADLLRVQGGSLLRHAQEQRGTCQGRLLLRQHRPGGSRRPRVHHLRRV